MLPLLTWIDTPCWVEEASKRVLNGTETVFEVSSFEVARLRVTVPWEETVVAKGRTANRRLHECCLSFIFEVMSAVKEHWGHCSDYSDDKV